jgi:hypothetical protein
MDIPQFKLNRFNQALSLLKKLHEGYKFRDTRNDCLLAMGEDCNVYIVGKKLSLRKGKPPVETEVLMGDPLPLGYIVTMLEEMNAVLV